MAAKSKKPTKKNPTKPYSIRLSDKEKKFCRRQAIKINEDAPYASTYIRHLVKKDMNEKAEERRSAK